MIYVTSDLHGCLEDWKQLLQKIRFSDNDTMFVLGDCVDLGPDPIGLLHDMMGRPNVFPILGNHEWLFARCARTIPPEADADNLMSFFDDYSVRDLAQWAASGGQRTLSQFLELDAEGREAILDYIGEMTLYEEVEADGVSFVLTHSGIEEFDPDQPLEDYPPSAFLMAQPEPGMEYFADRTVIVGHRPTYRLAGGTAGKILDDGGIIYIDCGAAHKQDGGCVGCLRLDDFAEFYID
ncbi:MAG TPA: metallophosphoesterase [Candidatus Butyricicoccus stercorigallinarum]|nr:metallophosphoesterase [Candidatus Butyricicoccus stercorigallinarum]